MSAEFLPHAGIGGDSAANAEPLHAGANERLARLGHDRVDDGLLKARRQVADQLGARVGHDLAGILAVKRVENRRLEAGKAQQQPLVVQERARKRERRGFPPFATRSISGPPG